jgi:hypothetical protein
LLDISLLLLLLLVFPVLSFRAHQLWSGFAHSGDPNIPPPGMSKGVINIPMVPKYSRAADEYVIFGNDGDGEGLGRRGEGAGVVANITVMQRLKEPECDFWDAYEAARNPYPPGP